MRSPQCRRMLLSCCNTRCTLTHLKSKRKCNSSVQLTKTAHWRNRASAAACNLPILGRRAVSTFSKPLFSSGQDRKTEPTQTTGRCP